MSKRAGSFLTWQYSLRPSVACLSLGMQSLPAEADGTWIVKGQRSPISTRQPSSTYPGATCSWCLLDPRACHTQTHVMKNSHFLFSCLLCVSLLFFNEKLSLSEMSSVTHTFPICAAYSSENVSPNWLKDLCTWAGCTCVLCLWVSLHSFIITAVNACFLQARHLHHISAQNSSSMSKTTKELQGCSVACIQ